MQFRKIVIAAAATLAAATGVNAQDKTVDFKLSILTPPSHGIFPGLHAWRDAVNEASNGSIKVTIYDSSQLGAPHDQYDIVKRGIADSAIVVPAYTPGRFPVIAATGLPFMLRDSEKAAPGLLSFYTKYAEKEMPDMKVCHVFTTEPSTIHTKTKVTVPSDLKGLNIRTPGDPMSSLITSAGANSVQISITEAFEALNRGAVDGVMVGLGELAHPAFKFDTVTEYSLDVPMYVAYFVHGIRRATYDGMSDAQKKVVDDHCTPEWSAKLVKNWHDQQVKGEQAIRDSGRKLTPLTDSELEIWQEAAASLTDTWKAAVNAAGYDADQVLTDFQAELKAAGGQF